MKFSILCGLLLALMSVFGSLPAAFASYGSRPFKPSISAPPPKRERPIIYDAPIRRPGPKTIRHLDSIDKKGQAEERVYFLRLQQEQLEMLRQKIAAQKKDVHHKLTNVDKEIEELERLRAKKKIDNAEDEEDENEDHAKKK